MITRYPTDDCINEIKDKIKVFEAMNNDPLLAIANVENGADLLKYFLDNEPNIILKNYQAESSIISAAMNPVYNIVNYFREGNLSNLYDPNFLNKQGQTMLHNLYRSKDMLDIVIEKFKSHIDINTPNSQGETILMKAAEYGFKDSVEYLVDKGANMEARDNTAQNLLHKIAKQYKERDKDGQSSVIDLLREKNLLKNLWQQKDKDGKTPLHYAQENTYGKDLIRYVEANINAELIANISNADELKTESYHSRNTQKNSDSKSTLGR